MARRVIAQCHEASVAEEFIPRLDIRRIIEEVRKEGGAAPAHSRYDNETQWPISFVTLSEQRIVL